MRKIQILFCVLILSANLFANNYADFKFIGFSEGGKYLAFTESGEWDYFGGVYTTTYFIDTAKNSYAVKPSAFSWTREDLPQSKKSLAARYRQSVKANLKRFAIVSDNSGKLVLAHLLNDLSFVKPVMQEDYFERSDGSQTDALMPNYEGGFVRRGEGVEKTIFEGL